MATVRLSYLTTADIDKLWATMTIAEVVEIALDVLGRMPQPVRWVAGPLTSGRRTPAENRTRLHRMILHYKEENWATFNYLPFQRRAMQILRRRAKGHLSKDDEQQLQEALRDELYAPIFKSGMIAKLYIMPNAGASLNVHWMRGFACARNIPTWLIPEELVPLR